MQRTAHTERLQSRCMTAPTANSWMSSAVRSRERVLSLGATPITEYRGNAAALTRIRRFGGAACHGSELARCALRAAYHRNQASSFCSHPPGAPGARARDWNRGAKR
eukprot:gene10470-biopygen3302